MDINVKVTIGAEPEMLMHLATLVECLQNVMKVTAAQTTAAEPEKSKKKAAAKPAEKKAEPAPVPAAEEKAPEPEPAPAPQPEPEPEPEPAPEPAPEQAVKGVSEEELRAACMEFAKKDPANKKKLAEAFKTVGASKLSDVKPEDYQKVIDLLKTA